MNKAQKRITAILERESKRLKGVAERAKETSELIIQAPLDKVNFQYL